MNLRTVNVPRTIHNENRLKELLFSFYMVNKADELLVITGLSEKQLKQLITVPVKTVIPEGYERSETAYNKFTQYVHSQNI